MYRTPSSMKFGSWPLQHGKHIKLNGIENEYDQTLISLIVYEYNCSYQSTSLVMKKRHFLEFKIVTFKCTNLLFNNEPSHYFGD